MISANEVGEIYQRIVQKLPGMLHASHAYLLLHNRVTKNLDVVAGTEKYPHPEVPLDSVAGPVACFSNNAVLEVPDAGSCPFVDRATARRLDQKSVLYVPLVSQGEVFGVLEIDDRLRKRRFTEEQKACAQHVANLGALAMKLCEQRSMREQLHRTEKLAAVGELISGVAHELKSPLASLGGLAELALARFGSLPVSQELKGIQAEARHAANILQRLISFAQKSGPKLVDVNATLRSVVSQREAKWESRGVRVRTHFSTSPPIVNTDPAHLEQVFLNLLITVEQALQQARDKLITIRTAIVAKRVLISISDSGLGLNAEAQQRAYGSFFDSRPGETAGLGLAVCQSLIEGHGGTIRVSSSAGQTTTFEIEYPLASGVAREPSPAAPPASEGARVAGDLTALVIDEDRKVQDSLLSLLSDRHYRVITVSSAEEALDLAERARFDVVLCDVRLRGMSGIELYGRLQHRIQSFVFLTADSFGDDLQEMFSEHNQAVLAKPFTAADVQNLLDKIEPRLLGLHAPKSAGR